MRTSVRALIENQGNILFIKRDRKGDVYYVLPGGGVEEDENPVNALQREIREELSVEGMIGRQVLEFFDTFQGVTTHILIFECVLPTTSVSLGKGPERERQSSKNAYEPAWVPVGNLSTIDIRPPQLGEWMLQQMEV